MEYESLVKRMNEFREPLATWSKYEDSEIVQALYELEVMLRRICDGGTIDMERFREMAQGLICDGVAADWDQEELNGIGAELLEVYENNT